MNALDVVVLAATLAPDSVGGDWVRRTRVRVGGRVRPGGRRQLRPRVVTAFGGTRADGRSASRSCSSSSSPRSGRRSGSSRPARAPRVPDRSPLPLWDRVAGASAASRTRRAMAGDPVVRDREGLAGAVWRGTPGSSRPSSGSRPASRRRSRRGASPSPTRRTRRRSARSTPARPRERPDRQLPRRDRRAGTAVDPEGDRERVRQIQDGSGWVAAPGVVVTNAHVVAGERSTRRDDGRRCHAGDRRRFRSGTRRRGARRCRGWRRAPLHARAGAPAGRARCTAIRAAGR